MTTAGVVWESVWHAIPFGPAHVRC